MSTLEEQEKSHDYSTKAVFLEENYLYLLFAYVAGAALISGFLILGVYKASHHEKIKMVKKMMTVAQVLAFLGIANIFIILAWAYSIGYYAKMIGEFVCAIMLFFLRETYIFRWASIIVQIIMMIIQVYFMVSTIQDLVCDKRNLCDPGKGEYAMYLMYAQYCIAFIIEAIGVILTTNMMMSLGWFYTEQFPPQLNLEQYKLERPDKKSSIYDMFPHPVNYEF